MIWRNFCDKIVAVKFCNFQDAHWKMFRQISYLLISLLKTLLSRNFFEKKNSEREFLQFPHCDVNVIKHSWKCKILLPQFCRKNSVKSTFAKVVYTKLIWRKKLWCWISGLSTLCQFWKNQHFFRQINVLVKKLKYLISRKLLIMVTYSCFHCVSRTQCGKKIREIN